MGLELPVKIPVAAPLDDYTALKAEIDAAIQRSLKSGFYILGPEVQSFESEFAKFVGVDHAVGVANGTDAVLLALQGCGLEPGDEVITVSHTAVATVCAVELAGATPALADIRRDTFVMDVTQAASLITPRTKAIVPVHLYGHPVPMDEIMAFAERHGLWVVEDCAQAHGARWKGRRIGSWGHAAAFSFYPTKNLGAIGDGGAVVTNDLKIAERIHLLRQYGWQTRYISTVCGRNSRLDELQAALLRVKLKHLDDDNARRREIAALYTEVLTGTAIAPPSVAPQAEHVFHQYTVRTPQRDALSSFLKERGIGSAILYPVPIHKQPAYENRVRCGTMTETERAAAEILCLPVHPRLTDAQVEEVCRALSDFSKSAAG
jgi:dTDP-4-amino-4,6-dideoxygalactose transaminase